MDAFIEALLGTTPIERVIIAILVVGFISVSKMLLAEKDKRIEDANKVRDGISQPITEIKESIQRMEGKIVISKRAEENDKA